MLFGEVPAPINWPSGIVNMNENIPNMKLDCLLIQFAKFPRLGGVKTRLKSLLHDDGCFKLHLELMQRVNENLQASGIFHVLSIDQLGQDDTVNQLASHTPILLQQGDDLGQRMQHALAWGLQRAKKVIIVGSDCPVLTAKHLIEVRNTLDQHDHVFIPAEDGGYVLIASTQCFPSIFQGISWGSEEVMAQTNVKLLEGGKSVGYLPELWDIDRPDDYKRLLTVFPHWPHHPL
jgi:rSAM/selenodomain-associated transferase 1